MAYNLHPIFVHFPIALLFSYSVLKLLPLKRRFPRVAWHDIERVLLVVGVFGAFAALATGDTAEHMAHANRQLVEAHATFATAATWLYTALLVGEVASGVNVHFPHWEETRPNTKKFLTFLERTLGNPVFSSIIAVIALVAITLAGMLGGAIVYGTTADPFAAIVLKILGITL